MASTGNEDDDERRWWAAPRPKRRAAPVVVAVLFVLAAGAVGLYLLLARGGPGRASGPPTAAASASAIEAAATLEPLAFGVRSPVADDVFGKRMTAFAIALDESRDPGAGAELARARSALQGADVTAAIGGPAQKELASLLDAADAAMRAPPDDEATTDALEVAAARLDNALITARHPYFVDASVIVDRQRARRLIVLYEFSIVASNLYASPGSGVRVRAVRLRRLDQLNWQHSLLGFVKPRRLQAAVLLDPIDDQLVNHVLPALADSAAMPLLAPEPSAASSASREVSGISTLAGGHVREEVAALPGIDVAAARALGEALRARRDLVERWDARAQALGATVNFPTGLAADVTLFQRDLKGIAEPRELAELGKLQARLVAPDVTRTYELLRDAYAASVERHEVQHRLDQMTPIPTPSALDAFVKPGRGPAGDAARDKIKSELSAYVAQLAREPQLVRTTFALVVRFLVDPKLRGVSESYSAAIALEALARELGVTDVAPLVHDGEVDEARLVRAHQALTAVGSQRLAGAARNVWATLFGRDLAPLERVP